MVILLSKVQNGGEQYQIFCHVLESKFYQGKKFFRGLEYVQCHKCTKYFLM